MSTTSSTPASDTAGNIPEFSVSELSGALKRTVESAYSHVRVRGEISGFKRAASGHLYMDLKDEGAVLNAVCWRGVAGRIRFQPEDGLEVVAVGKISTYAQRSNYQLIIESLEPAGAGALMALLDERRKKLAAEGLFDEDRKQPIPFLPSVIGIVTSPTGAVIRDILHRLADRFPRHVLLWPVVVQGERAAEQISAAIKGFNGLEQDGMVPRPDLLIVARGGGSLEDLWAFNEEVVVRAAADSVIPIISAVGHETDTTLIDFASDLRAPTPTAAAELAVPVKADLEYTIADLDRRQHQTMRRLMEEAAAQVQSLARGLPSRDELLGLRQQRFDELGDRLPRALTANIEKHRRSLAENAAGLRKSLLLGLIERHGYALEQTGTRLRPAINRLLVDWRSKVAVTTRLLDSLSYQSILERGFALVRDASDRAVTSADAVRPGDRLSLQFVDSRVGVIAEGDKDKPVRAKAAIKKRGGPGGQRSLF